MILNSVIAVILRYFTEFSSQLNVIVIEFRSILSATKCSSMNLLFGNDLSNGDILRHYCVKYRYPVYSTAKIRLVRNCSAISAI